MASGTGVINLEEIVTPLVKAALRKELAGFSRKLASALKQAVEDEAAAEGAAGSEPEPAPKKKRGPLSPEAVERIRQGQRNRRNKPTGEAAETSPGIEAVPAGDPVEAQDFTDGDQPNP